MSHPSSSTSDLQTSAHGPGPQASAPLLFPWLESLSLTKLRLQFEVQDPIFIGPFPENRVRSSLGVHLRRQEVCASTPGLDCDRCSLTPHCLWFSLFGVPGHSTSRPYCLELALPGTPDRKSGAALGVMAPGATLALELTLFGQAALQPERLVTALSHPEAGRALFGGRMTLVDTQVLEPEGGTSPYREGQALRKPLLAWLEHPSRKALEDSRRWRISLLSPLTAKVHREEILRDGHDLSFPTLVRLAVRRTVQLAEDFGGFQRSEHPGEDFQPLLDAAHQVRVVDHSLKWLENNRRSARQGQQMTLGGLVGWLELEGDLAPFVPLMMAATHCHLGKRATFGFGAMTVRPASGASTARG